MLDAFDENEFSLLKTRIIDFENAVLVDVLKHNLLSISQLCDRGLKVVFDDSSVSYTHLTLPTIYSV